MYLHFIFSTAPPSAIDHENDVSAELVSLDCANITWCIPPDNNARIFSYTLIFCARVTSNSTVCGTLINITVPVGQLTQVGEDKLNYTINELLIETMYEVVIRAENSVGFQIYPELGNGSMFNSPFPDDGQVENLAFIPTHRHVVIVTWNLPYLALATADLNVSFNVTYFSNGTPDMVIPVSVAYNPMLLEQGVSIDLGPHDSIAHTINVIAL